MASPADVATDPVLLVLEECLRERSRGSMVAPLRDVWQMAQWRSDQPFTYERAREILVGSGRFQTTNQVFEPEMVRPAGEAASENC